MGTSLNGLTPSATYTGLLKFGDNSAISASLKAISDGAGNDTILELSTTALQIGGSTGAFWDNTNKRLGIGTNAPSATGHFKGSGTTAATLALLVQNNGGNNLFRVRDDGNIYCEGGGAISSVGIIGTLYGLFGSQSYDASVVLGAQSTSAGFLPPRMTTTQRNAISTPAEGLVIYNTTTQKLNLYTTAWEAITSL